MVVCCNSPPRGPVSTVCQGIDHGIGVKGAVGFEVPEYHVVFLDNIATNCLGLFPRRYHHTRWQAKFDYGACASAWLKSRCCVYRHIHIKGLPRIYIRNLGAAGVPDDYCYIVPGHVFIASCGLHHSW